MLPSATNGHSRTVYGILGMNCIGLPLFSVLTAVCKVIVSMNKRRRFLIRTVLRNKAVFVSFILIFPMLHGLRLPNSTVPHSKMRVRCILPASRSQSTGRVSGV